jgi:hypothetical protein
VPSVALTGAAAPSVGAAAAAVPSIDAALAGVPSVGGAKALRAAFAEQAALDPISVGFAFATRHRLASGLRNLAARLDPSVCCDRPLSF